MSLKTIVTLIALAIVAVVVYDFVRAYRAATSTGLQRLWDAGRGSATMVVAQLGAIVMLLVTASDKLVDWICALVNAPGADDAIKQAISSYVNTTTVGAVMVAYIALVAWARTRTL